MAETPGASSPYPPSYYAASRNIIRQSAVLEGEVNTDICVVGAGYSGLPNWTFDIGGNKTLKVFSSRPATKREIALGLSYVSKADGKEKVRVLKALNPAFDDIRVTDDVQWIGWLDKKDN